MADPERRRSPVPPRLAELGRAGRDADGAGGGDSGASLVSEGSQRLLAIYDQVLGLSPIQSPLIEVDPNGPEPPSPSDSLFQGRWSDSESSSLELPPVMLSTITRGVTDAGPAAAVAPAAAAGSAGARKSEGGTGGKRAAGGGKGKKKRKATQTAAVAAALPASPPSPTSPPLTEPPPTTGKKKAAKKKKPKKAGRPSEGVALTAADAETSSAGSFSPPAVLTTAPTSGPTSHLVAGGLPPLGRQASAGTAASRPAALVQQHSASSSVVHPRPASLLEQRSSSSVVHPARPASLVQQHSASSVSHPSRPASLVQQNSAASDMRPASPVQQHSAVSDLRPRSLSQHHSDMRPRSLSQHHSDLRPRSPSQHHGASSPAPRSHRSGSLHRAPPALAIATQQQQQSSSSLAPAMDHSFSATRSDAALLGGASQRRGHAAEPSSGVQSAVSAGGSSGRTAGGSTPTSPTANRIYVVDDDDAPANIFKPKKQRWTLQRLVLFLVFLVLALYDIVTDVLVFTSTSSFLKSLHERLELYSANITAPEAANTSFNAVSKLFDPSCTRAQFETTDPLPTYTCYLAQQPCVQDLVNDFYANFSMPIDPLYNDPDFWIVLDRQTGGHCYYADNFEPGGFETLLSALQAAAWACLCFVVFSIVMFIFALRNNWRARHFGPSTFVFAFGLFLVEDIPQLVIQLVLFGQRTKVQCFVCAIEAQCGVTGQICEAVPPVDGSSFQTVVGWESGINALSNIFQNPVILLYMSLAGIALSTVRITWRSANFHKCTPWLTVYILCIPLVLGVYWIPLLWSLYLEVLPAIGLKTSVLRVAVFIIVIACMVASPVIAMIIAINIRESLISAAKRNAEKEAIVEEYNRQRKIEVRRDKTCGRGKGVGTNKAN